MPAVSLAVAAPAFAASSAVGVTWDLTADEDLQFSKAGDLVWTVLVADLEAGSTVELKVSDVNSDLENYIWIEALNGLSGPTGAQRIEEGASITLTFTTTAAVPVGSTFGITMAPENSNGSYESSWVLDPANPVGANLSGNANWSASGGFTQ